MKIIKMKTKKYLFTDNVKGTSALKHSLNILEYIF